MFSSLILRRPVGGILTDIVAGLVFCLWMVAAQATPLQNIDIPAASHASPSAPSLDSGDPSVLDAMPVPLANPAIADDAAIAGSGVPQHDFLDNINAPKTIINRDPFQGLSTISIDEKNGNSYLRNPQDLLHLPGNDAASKKWFFDSNLPAEDLRHGGKNSELPGISELIFDSPVGLSVLHSVADVKYAGAHAVDFSVLGLGEFTLERLPDSRGIVIREDTTGVEIGLHHTSLGGAEAGNAPAHAEDDRDQMVGESNFSHVIIGWVAERLMSPLGILGCMFVVVVLILWAIANSIMVLRRRMRHQPNA